MNWNGHERTPSTLCTSSQRVCADFAFRLKVKKLRKIFLCTTSPVIVQTRNATPTKPDSM